MEEMFFTSSIKKEKRKVQNFFFDQKKDTKNFFVLIL
jgi:hypothetical protein